MKQTVHLGFEIPSGEPVEIPVAHLVVAGQTQLSGKTTTLEGLISRSGRKAIAFVTKRGEGAFGYAHRTNGPDDYKVSHLDPYFRHRADWQFVSDILGAVLSEKLKFQRPWIMKVCRGAKTLREVQANVKQQLAGDKQKKIRSATGLTESVYTELDAYFDLLIPEIEALPYTDKLELQSGLNVMDLSAYSPALQMLVISAVLERINQAERNTIVVVPEAWEFVPNNRSSPVKSAAIALARKGAALHNFMWLDSQDLASIDTEVRRACSVWILGVQREHNEVKRMLSHIPNAPKPKVDDVMQLERGQFFVCHGREVKKVYVQPAWMSEKMAKDIAQGKEPATEYTITRVKSSDLKPPQPSRRIDVTICDDDMKPATREAVVEMSRAAGDHMADIAIGEPVTERDYLIKPTDYQTMPAGLDYYLDDGGKSVDQQERERYENLIAALERDLYETQRAMPGLNYANTHSFEEWKANPDKRHWSDTPKDNAIFAPEKLAQQPGTSGKRLFDAAEVFNAILKSPPSLKQLAEAMRPYLPTNGHVTVEPREYVLKEFLQKEVERILARVKNFSKWQKGIIQLLEARGTGLKRADLYRRVGGKEQSGFSGQQTKQMNADVVDLGDMGFIKWDSKNSYATPNLETMIKSELSAYNPSDEDVANTIGKVLLGVKE